MLKTNKKFQAGDAHKWQAPAMSVDPNQVIRHHYEHFGSKGSRTGIPTAIEIEQWRKDAEREGYQQGLHKAEQESLRGKQKIQQLFSFFENPLQALNEEIEQQLAHVAIALAQQLVRRELRIEPGEIIGLIQDLLRLLPGNARNIRIVMNPEDATLVRSALSMDSGDDEANWKLIEDPMITRGGCEVRSESSKINATLENRLSTLAASVLGGEREQD